MEPSEKTEVAAAPAEQAEEGFVRGLGLFDATMLVAGSMIGSGIFIVSKAIAHSTGSPFWLLCIWTLSGVMTVLGALSYGELAALLPRAGGQYVYLREAHGRLVAFLYGWTLFLVIQTGTIAAVGRAFGKFLGVLVPVLKEENVIFKTGIPAGYPFASFNPAQVVAVLLIVLLTAVNLRGIQAGKWVQNTFTAAKITSLLAVLLVGAAAVFSVPGTGNFGSGFWGSFAPRPSEITPAFLTVLGAAMVGALFSSDAWNNVTFAAAEVRNPRRNVALSLALGTGLVTLLYLGANVAYLLVLNFHDLAHAPKGRVATAMLENLFGAPGAAVMAAAILVSTFGCNNGLILAGARVTYAMARDRLFFRGAGELNRRGAPGRALIWQCAVASVLAISGTYDKLLDYVIFAALLFYMATVLAVFALRRKRPEAPRPYRAAGYPFLPALYIVLAAGVAATLLIHPSTQGSSLIGLGIVAAGVPVYALLRRTSPSRSAGSAPRGLENP